MNRIRLVSLLALLSLAAAGCKKDSQAQVPHYTIESPLVKRIADSTDLMAQVFSDTVFQVSEGVRESDVHYLSKEGYAMHAFILEVDLNNPKLKLEAGMPYNVPAYAMQTVPDMAKYMQAAGSPVLAAVNADFFNTSTGEPRGILVMNGKVMKTTWANARSSTFIGVKKDGKVFIGDRADFAAMQNDFEDALGGGPMLVKDNQILTQTDLSVEPRTGIGMSADGKLYFIVVDGRSFYYSNGITITQLGHMLKACGAVKAINVDGGGSSTFMIKHPLADVWQVRNRPSDGTNRPVGNAWLIVTKP
ncbi:phosphodiester glycosidase family protein [Chitinophaga lutea]|uniref:Phosphodiester glycosidase family protein n=1 Tax=Chitinophaga lutea TaxID=2488634 RepID=A0A3N4Q8Q0_9BACT|nr:phosphodiester glycosidase family protein [Chitinophaga lutea]RPE12380.1 phosphodiester glycosidase family protein [Chitinophaga lutea]